MMERKIGWLCRGRGGRRGVIPYRCAAAVTEVGVLLQPFATLVAVSRAAERVTALGTEQCFRILYLMLTVAALHCAMRS
jgi:hypothetical protein